MRRKRPVLQRATVRVEARENRAGVDLVKGLWREPEPFGTLSCRVHDDDIHPRDQLLERPNASSEVRRRQAATSETSVTKDKRGVESEPL